jgi:DNA (cytosine-5)-methyltransferase 1
MKLRIFEGFAGFGGASFGLKKAGIPHTVVGYSEIDKYATQLYELNHPGVKNFGDISTIKPKDLPDFDLFTGGFPCQPFSNAGLGLGENDERGQLIWDIVRICEKKKPKYILLENVKGFLTKRHKPTLDRLTQKLESFGYRTSYAILNSADFGNAQTRQRFWFLAVLKPKFKLENYFMELPLHKSKIHIKKFLDKKPSLDLYLTQDQCRHLIKKHSVDLNVPTSLCLDIYNKKIKYDGSCITLTEPHHNGLRIVEPMLDSQFRVRKLSVEEMFRLMGLSKKDIITGELSYFQLAKRAANGWDVMVVQLIFKKLFNEIKPRS